jgi:hypothetical protein
MEPRYTISSKIAIACLAAIFAVQVYRAATRPIGRGEAYLYDRFVRPSTRQVLASELLDRDVLYSLLEKRSVGLFHVSPFSVRLPALLFGLFYLWSVWLLARRFAVVTVVVGAIPLIWELFARADGIGVALALCAGAIWLAAERKHMNLIGICLGLSIAANIAFSIPAVVLALAILVIQRRWNDWTNHVLIPCAVVVLIFLVLPLSHAHASAENRPELTTGQAVHLETALQALRASAGSKHIRVGAISAVEPVVNFYRAQHRATAWERAESNYDSEHFDYYLISAAEAGWAQERHLIEVYRDTDFLLVRRPAASM